MKIEPEKIIHHFEAPVTLADLARALQCSDATARYVLFELTRQGLVHLVRVDGYFMYVKGPLVPSESPSPTRTGAYPS
jgi:Mn-dependent DtxR family transcriptional regulator